MNLLSAFDNTWAFLALVLGFGFIIFVHELGHFMAAKWVGIKVTQFAVGFGQSLLTWRKGLGFRVGSTEAEYDKLIKEGADASSLGETEYRLNWMPLGGYVKMLGQEDMDPTAASDDPRSFNKKPVWARAVVLSAGVVMNMIFAVIFFIIAFMAGVAFPPAIVGGVAPGAPADISRAVGHEEDPAYRGLRAGDRVTQINDTLIYDFTDLSMRVGLAKGNEPLLFTVDRGGELLQYRITPKPDPHSRLLSAGIATPTDVTLHDAASLPPSLREAGVEPGMAIRLVDGQPVQRYDQYAAIVTAARGRPVEVTFVDPKTEREVVTTVRASPQMMSSDGLPHLMGAVPAAVIRGVVPGSPAEDAGLKQGDIMMQAGKHALPLGHEISDIIRAADGEPVPMVVLRGDEVITTPPIAPKRALSARNRIIGVQLDANDGTLISRVLPGSPLAQVNLTPGSRIVHINGKPVQSFGDMQFQLAQAAAAGDAAVTIGYQVNLAGDPAGEVEIPLTEQLNEAISAAAWAEPLTEMNFEVMRVRVVAQTPWQAVELGVSKTRDIMLATYTTIVRLSQGSVHPSNLHGPIGIAHVGTRVARQGWTYLMFFLGLISVNLAVINFLPIPIVDGGHMVFLGIEKIKGSPVGPRVQTVASIVGLVLLASVFLMTLYFDTARLISGM